MKDDRSALDEASEEKVRGHFKTIPLLRTLGVSLGEIRHGFCEMRLPIRPELCQEHGYLHGGLVGTLLDSAAGHAARTILPDEYGAVTVEYKLNLLAPAVGEYLIARAEVIKGGRTLTVMQGDAYAVKEGKETHCATAIVTYLSLKPK